MHISVKWIESYGLNWRMKYGPSRHSLTETQQWTSSIGVSSMDGGSIDWNWRDGRWRKVMTFSELKCFRWRCNVDWMRKTKIWLATKPPAKIGFRPRNSLRQKQKILNWSSLSNAPLGLRTSMRRIINLKLAANCPKHSANGWFTVPYRATADFGECLWEY